MNYGSGKNQRFCPNCVTQMVNRIRNRKRVYACPSCGVIEQADEPQESRIIKVTNDERINGTEPFYDCSEDNIIYHYIKQKDPS